jgi:5-methylcytosine-specific restriction endonuclease McrA
MPSTPHIEQKFLIQFLASGAFKKKLERAQALLSNQQGKPSYEAVLEAALDEFLKGHDPEKREQRREQRRQRAASPRIDSEASRRIPAAVRDAVFARDKGRCAYVGSNGVRCAATHHLQIDHIVPYARGGTNSVHNLRLLCERHNKLEAERVYGKGAMKRFRARP